LAVQTARAMDVAEADLIAIFEQAEVTGMGADALAELLVEDLQSNGPVFGKFVSNVMGASEASVLEAQRTGTAIGELYRLPQMTAHEKELLFAGDPEQMALIEEEAVMHERYTWIAENINTCALCLPLHGHTMTRAEWQDSGSDPSSIHTLHGFNSHCHCALVFEEYAANRKDLMAPLARNPLESKRGLKGNRRTARSVLQKDLDKSLAAVEQAQATEKGRRTLRLLGKSNA